MAANPTLGAGADQQARDFLDLQLAANTTMRGWLDDHRRMCFVSKNITNMYKIENIWYILHINKNTYSGPTLRGAIDAAIVLSGHLGE